LTSLSVPFHIDRILTPLTLFTPYQDRLTALTRRFYQSAAG
jgi:hypothetical protein